MTVVLLLDTVFLYQMVLFLILALILWNLVNTFKFGIGLFIPSVYVHRRIRFVKKI